MWQSQQEIEHLEELVATLTSRLRILDKQVAAYGELAAPAHILLDKHETEQKLKHARTTLRRLKPPATAESAPYVGLSSFQETDAAVFFGREGLVELLVEKIKSERFLAVLGPSGSGKSSVVLAGLLPALRRGDLPGSERWRYLALKPGARPLDALAVALTTLQGGDQLGGALAIRDQLGRDDRALLLAADLLLAGQPATRLVLVIDQFEELWTQAPAAPEARAPWIEQQHRGFIQQMLTAAASDCPIAIVLTMRADFLHRAAESRDLARWIGEHDVIISPMAPYELRRAIECPADRAGGDFEPGLVDELSEQVQGRPGALPLLQYTLLELWKAKQPDGTMTWESFRGLGGVEGALAARADALLAERYRPEQRDELRHLLLRLVQPGEGVADTRRRALLQDIVPAGGSVEAVQALLKPLVDERLITTGYDAAAGAETVELSHEALIRAWPTFGAWISETRADLRHQLQLEEAAKEWQASDANDDFLWSGLRLANAEAWIARARPRLTERARRFLEASRAAEQQNAAVDEAARRERETLLEARAAAERRNASRLRVFLVVGSVLLLAALILAYYANLATEQATRSAQSEAEARADAERKRLAAEQEARAGESLFDLARGNSDRAVLLAYAAIPTDTQTVTPLIARAQRRAFEDAVSSVLFDHTQWITAVAWSPNGRWILTGSTDHIARIWDVATGAVVRQLEGHTGDIDDVAWSPDGRQILTGGEDRIARIWDAASGKSVRTLTGHTDWVEAVAWSPDGQRLLTGGDRTARIWDAATGALLRTLEGHTGKVNDVAWSPDGQQVCTSGEDGTARIWNATTGMQMQTLKVSGISNVAWSPGGRQILTGGYSVSMIIWDARNGAQVRELHSSALGGIMIAWSPDGRHILSGSYDNTVHIWDAATGALQHTLQGHTDEVRAVAWSPNGHQVVIGSRDGSIRVWHVPTDIPVRVLEDTFYTITAAAWSPNGRQVITGGGENSTHIWDSATGAQLRRLGIAADIWTAAWSPDGRQIVTSSKAGVARIWDAATGKLVRELRGHTDWITWVVWSGDGRQVLTSSTDKTVRIWDAATGKPARVLDAHPDQVNAVALSPDGRQVLTGSSDNIARIWDATTGRLVRELKGHTDGILAAAWSPDGQQIVTSSNDRTARIWDPATGKLTQVLEGHAGRVWAATWSPDGRYVLTGGDDATARIWDARTGQQVDVLEGHTGGVTAVAWSPAGRQVLTGSQDRSARIWIVDKRLIVAELTRRVCDHFADDKIHTTISTWRGCAAELAAVKDNLATYDALRGGR